MNHAAVGFRPHSGWAALVALALENHQPVILSRERVQLVKDFSYKFRQPYHTAEKLPLAQGREFISHVRSQARILARRALQAVQQKVARKGQRLGRCALILASGRTLPSLEKILASHTLIHTADGELFREALLHASAQCGLAVLRVRERELLDYAAQRLGFSESTLLRRITELGRPLGSPWSQDEKFAAIVAWLALVDGTQSAVSGMQNPAVPADGQPEV